MQLKDYYKILEVEPSATMPQIKKSFRQKALLYHPDKNPGNALAEGLFKEIREAYEILIDQKKREEYNYKRWYNRSIHEPFVQETITPSSILQECIRLNNFMQTPNAFRVDFDGLSYHIRQLLSNKNISLLLQFNDETVNAGIIEKILQAASVLPFQYLEPITSLLLRVADNNALQQRQVAHFLVHQKQQNKWQRYRPIIVITVTLLICWLIYLVSS